MAISFSGAFSGIDTKSIVDTLMAVKRQPLDNLNAKKGAYNQRLTVISDLRTKLAALGSAAERLNSLREFRKFTASSSDADDEHFSASVGSGAQAASHSVKVMQLAKAETEISQSFAATTSAVAQGDLKIRVAGGSWETVTIDASNNTLSGVRDAINARGLGVNATIMNVGGATPYALLLTSEDTGASQTIELDTSGLSGTDPVLSFTQRQAAADAQIVFDGVTVNSETNEFESIVSGVTLNAKKVDVGGEYTLNIASNVDGVTEDLTNFTTKYNELMAYLDDKLAPTANNRDTALSQIRSQLRTALTLNNANSGAYSNLAQIGITTDADGKLQVDSEELGDALEDNFDDVAKLISAYGEGSNANITYSFSGAKTQDGVYAINITGLGSSFGGTIGGYAATVMGTNMLKGAAGTPVEGLTVAYTGSSTGNVGDVTFHAGIFEKVDRLLDGYLSSSSGLLKNRENSINKAIRSLDIQIDAKEKALEKVEERLTLQYTKMETAIAQMQAQSGYFSMYSK